MTGKVESRFEEAERKRGVILASIGATFGVLAWLARDSTTLMGAVGLLAAYLMTGDRYQWVYIWKKTFRRDMLVLDSEALLDELEDGGMEDVIYCD